MLCVLRLKLLLRCDCLLPHSMMPALDRRQPSKRLYEACWTNRLLHQLAGVRLPFEATCGSWRPGCCGCFGTRGGAAGVRCLQCGYGSSEAAGWLPNHQFAFKQPSHQCACKQIYVCALISVPSSSMRAAARGAVISSCISPRPEWPTCDCVGASPLECEHQ